MRFCIVGSGPAGLFLAGRLLKKNPQAVINVVDSRLNPFGLVRYGVAPDHPEVKVGGALDIHELGNLHDAVIICTGMPAPRLLNIPGESLPGSYTSSQIVGWYNNDPEYLQKNISLRNVKKVAVIGHGNVALDVARLLLKSPESLQNTEISTRALDELRNSSVKEVDIIGRRGPLQLREMFDLQGVLFQTDSDLVAAQLQQYEALWCNTRPMKRLMELLRINSRQREYFENSRTWRLRYFLNPKKIIGTDRVEAVEFEETRLKAQVGLEKSSDLHGMPVINSGKHIINSYDMVVSCIGFQGSSNFNLPADSSGVIQNIDGRVTGHPGIYVSGWAATGPKGELASTMQNSRQTADILLSDLQLKPNILHRSTLEEYLNSKSVSYKILNRP